jgi:hypothetical protein
LAGHLFLASPFSLSYLLFGLVFKLWDFQRKKVQWFNFWVFSCLICGFNLSSVNALPVCLVSLLPVTPASSISTSQDQTHQRRSKRDKFSLPGFEWSLKYYIDPVLWRKICDQLSKLAGTGKKNLGRGCANSKVISGIPLAVSNYPMYQGWISYKAACTFIENDSSIAGTAGHYKMQMVWNFTHRARTHKYIYSTGYTVKSHMCWKIADGLCRISEYIGFQACSSSERV